MIDVYKRQVIRKQEMHNTRGKSKKRAEEKEIEEGGQEQEIELVTDSEMDQPDKAVAREKPNWQDMMKFMAEQFKEQNKQMNENFRKQEENSKRLRKTMDEGFKKVAETMDRCVKNMNKAIETTSEGRKEIEITEYQGVMPSENKNSHNKKDVRTVEKKTKEIRKTSRKKIINTKEEWEMITGGLINVFNLPINEQRELIKFRSQLNVSTMEVYQTISVVSSRRNTTCLLYTSRCV